ncbi:MAG: GNAT family N-acetyltransferase [Kosmotoga sp.]|nr:MAG: GNAT family N-acetyltransferase [Kosmotoga sp.]
MIAKRVTSRRNLRKFINLPYEIYEDYPCWVPPYLFDERKIVKNGSSVMNKDREFFIVLDGPQPVARLAVYINKASRDALSKGYFTLFESYNDEVAVKMLFSMADSWFMMRQIDRYTGPESHTNGEDYKGLLVNNFDDFPYINMSYNPPYYKELLKFKNLEKTDSLACFHYDIGDGISEQISELVEYSKNRFEFHVETPDINNIENLAEDIIFVLENSLPDTNEGMRELTKEDVKKYFSEMISYIDRELFAVAYHENQPIGFSAAIPNYNEFFEGYKTRIPIIKRLRFSLCKNKIRSFRIFNVAVIKAFQKKGVSHAMHLHIIKNAFSKGYKDLEGGPINFDNIRSFQDAIKAGGKPYKEYALYRRKIT